MVSWLLLASPMLGPRLEGSPARDKVHPGQAGASDCTALCWSAEAGGFQQSCSRLNSAAWGHTRFQRTVLPEVSSCRLRNQRMLYSPQCPFIPP